MTKRRNYYGYIDSLPKTDKRIPKYKKQLSERGFDDTEVWSLDITFSKFILPRLKRFKETYCGHPYGITEKQWCEFLDKMIACFEIMADGRITNLKEDRIIGQGLILFARWFRCLWS